MGRASTAAGVPDELRRRLRLADAVTIGLGSMIGAGIFAAAADLVVPIGEDLTGGGVEKEVAGEVPLPGRPVGDARVEGEAAGLWARMSILRETT